MATRAVATTFTDPYTLGQIGNSPALHLLRNVYPRPATDRPQSDVYHAVCGQGTSQAHPCRTIRDDRPLGAQVDCRICLSTRTAKDWA